MDYTLKINALELEIGELKNQLNEAIRNGDREKELVIHNRITAKDYQLTEIYKLSAPPCKNSFLFYSFALSNDPTVKEFLRN
jgi:hypothetical protein